MVGTALRAFAYLTSPPSILRRHVHVRWNRPAVIIGIAHARRQHDRRARDLLVRFLRAEAHHALDAGAVVPAAVEQHDLAAGRQMRHIALEIPLRALALARRRKCCDPADARIEALGDALDDAAFAGGIAALEQ